MEGKKLTNQPDHPKSSAAMMKNPITNPEKIRIATTSIVCLLNASFIPGKYDSLNHSFRLCWCEFLSEEGGEGRLL